MNIKQLLAIAKVKPNPKIYQYFFLYDLIFYYVIKIAKLTKKDVVLEVGAGIGNLTILVSKRAQVIAVEKDYAFSHVLKNMPNTKVVLGDALEFLESLRGKNNQKEGIGMDSKKPAKPSSNGTPFNKIVSNIPYSLSQRLTLEFFRHKW